MFIIFVHLFGMSFFTQVVVEVVLTRVEDTFWNRDGNLVTILFNLTKDFLGRIFDFRNNLLPIDSNSIYLVAWSDIKFTLDIFLDQGSPNRFQNAS